MFVVNHDRAGERLDVFLAGQNVLSSRATAQRLIKSDHVRVGGIGVKSSYQVREGDQVIVCVPIVCALDVLPEKIPINIIYEDRDIIIVNKERGMVVHPAPGNYNGTLVNALLYHSPKLSGIGGALRPGIVHRLDKDTSGLLMVAKNDKSHRKLAAQLKAREVTREYVAIVCGRVRDVSGIIDAPIGRHPVYRKKMAVLEDGRSAVTHFRVLEYLTGFTYVLVKLETGRTHQIRVHMAHIGHPVLGDEKYGGAIKRIRFNGHALHAWNLSFKHPRTGDIMEFTSDVPEDMVKVLMRLRRD
jgi:23S rRNA pseudouridine1911/1915/1917 synthase